MAASIKIMHNHKNYTHAFKILHYCEILFCFLEIFSSKQVPPLLAKCPLFKFLNVFDRKIVDNWCKTMLFNGITNSNENVVNRKTIGLGWLEMCDMHCQL